MRREQGTAAVFLVQVLDRRPGDREPVEGRGAAADLVEDDERARARLVEDRRRLDHLDHEGRAPAGEVVRRADAREQPVDDADMRLAGGHEGADLGEHDDERVLAQIGRLAAHVRAGDQRDAARLGARACPGAREVAVVRDEGDAVAAQCRLDHRVASARDPEGEAAVDLRPGPILHDGKLGERRRDIDGREDRKSTRLNSSHTVNSYAVFCLKKKNTAYTFRGLLDHHANGDAQAFTPPANKVVILASCWNCFFFNDTATTEIYTLSLHDALPISQQQPLAHLQVVGQDHQGRQALQRLRDRKSTRLNSSHTVISYAVFCLKKKKKKESGDVLSKKKKKNKGTTP